MIRTKFLITFDASSNLPIANTGKGSVSMRNGVHFYIKTIPDKMYTCTVCHNNCCYSLKIEKKADTLPSTEGRMFGCFLETIHSDCGVSLLCV